MEPFDLTTAPYREHVRYLLWPVPPEHGGKDVGTLLRRSLGLSTTLVKRIKYLPDGIALDGVRATTRTTAQAGQLLQVRLSDSARHSEIQPAPGPLDLLYEDEDLLVLNKAPGVAVHPGVGHWNDTLGSFLLDYYDRRGIPADFHPVHRLDRGTSGVMVVAKHPFAQEKLRQSLHGGAFFREYLAVCDGVPEREHGVVELPLAHAKDSVIGRPVCLHGVPSAARLAPARAGAPASENRPHTSDPRSHGSHRLSPNRRFFVWYGAGRADFPPGPPFLRPFVYPSADGSAPFLLRALAGRYEPSAVIHKRCKSLACFCIACFSSISVSLDGNPFPHLFQFIGQQFYHCKARMHAQLAEHHFGIRPVDGCAQQEGDAIVLVKIGTQQLYRRTEIKIRRIIRQQIQRLVEHDGPFRSKIHPFHLILRRIQQRWRRRAFLYLQIQKA